MKAMRLRMDIVLINAKIDFQKGMVECDGEIHPLGLANLTPPKIFVAFPLSLKTLEVLVREFEERMGTVLKESPGNRLPGEKAI